MKKLRANSGFTLVELIVVLVILAVLAAILVPTLTGYISQAQNQKDYDTAAELKQAAQSVLTKQYAQQYSKHWTYENLNPVASSDGMVTNGVTERDGVLQLAGLDWSKVNWFWFNVSKDGAITPTIVTGNRNFAHTVQSGNELPTSVCIQGKVYYMQSDGSWASAKTDDNGRTFTTTGDLQKYDYKAGGTITSISGSRTWAPNKIRGLIRKND